MADRSVSRSIRPPLLGLLLVALAGAVATGAAADRVANVTVKLDVNSNHRTCKDLFVGVEVYDSLGNLLASCHWDGRSDAFGTKACEKHFDRTIDSFVVYLTVRYKGEELAHKRVFIRVLPGQGIVVDFDGQVVTITGRDGRQEFRPIRVTQAIDGQVVELILRPGAKVGKAEVTRDSSLVGGEDWRERMVSSLFWVDGSVVVHDKEGRYRIDLSARVEHTALSPIAIIAGPVAPARSTRFADVALHVPLGRVNVHASLGSVGWWRARERVRVVFETPEGSFELEPPNTLELSLPPKPFRVRVEVCEGRELKACSEYEIQPGPAVLHLFGPRYIQVRLTSKILKRAPSVKFLQPEVLRAGRIEPSTEVRIPFIIETPTDAIPYTFHILLSGPYLLPDGGTILTALLTFSTFNLVRVLNHLLNVPDDVLNRPLILPRLPPRYALIGLAACLTTLAARHYLGVATLATLGVEIEGELGFITLPLGVWGARLIAAATGLPLPLIGALTKLVQWIFDQQWRGGPLWEVPHLVLTTPITWYLERALQEWQRLAVYLLLGAIGINLPLPLYSSVYIYPIFDEPPEETLPHLPDILLGIALLPAHAALQLLTRPLPIGLTNALTLLLMSPLGYYLPVPDPIAALLALPSALEHLVALLLAPALLLEGARTELKIALEVGPRTGRGEPPAASPPRQSFR